jgi:predicted Zn-dependent peptidase
MLDMESLVSVSESGNTLPDIREQMKALIKTSQMSMEESELDEKLASLGFSMTSQS